jgi:hypothetical protein
MDCDTPGQSVAPLADSVTPSGYVGKMKAPDSTQAGGFATSAEALTVTEAGTVCLENFLIEDSTVVTVLARVPEDQRAQVLHRMIGIGARAMVETAVGVDLAAVDERVLRSIEQATAHAETRVKTIVAEAEQAMLASLDPDTRTSAMARAICEFESVSQAISATVDPGRSDSHVATLLRSLGSLLGPGGDLEARLATALDPANEGSGLGSLRRDVERRFAELRDLLSEQKGRRDEAEFGTKKGFAFEDLVEDRLRLIARNRGAIVERTAETSGNVGDDLVGDFVVTLANGVAVVVEAKNAGRIGLNGSGGILAELDRAMSNRGAEIAICVSAVEAFPGEVGTFGVYGNRILVVDDGDGTMLEVAMRWATLTADMSARSDEGLDLEAFAALIDRIRRMSQMFSSHRRTLTDSIESINKVRDGLDDMRRDLVAHLDEVEFELERRPSALRVVG